MVRAEQKKQMSGFITGLLEESGLYNILEQNDSNILVVERPLTILKEYLLPIYFIRMMKHLWFGWVEGAISKTSEA